MSSTSDAFFLMSFQMSIVKMVDAELKIEVREDISAASITASMRPRMPKNIRRDVLKMYCPRPLYQIFDEIIRRKKTCSYRWEADLGPKVRMRCLSIQQWIHRSPDTSLDWSKQPKHTHMISTCH